MSQETFHPLDHSMWSRKCALYPGGKWKHFRKWLMRKLHLARSHH